MHACHPTLATPGKVLNRLTFFLAVSAIPLFSGCSLVDPYSVKFDQVEIGEASSQAVNLLGTPASINSIEVPLVKIEQLVWRAPLGSRVYIVHTALGYVVSKSVIQ